MFNDSGKLCKRYGVIVADCPWTYTDMKNGDPAMGGFKYPAMTLDALASLPITSIAKDNCALFMWATLPLLQQALFVIEQWGFIYTNCAFVWVKLNKNGVTYIYPVKTQRDVLLENGAYSGIGSYTNGNAELCLLAKRGSIKRKEKNVKQIVFAPLQRHSQKPEEVQNRIERLMVDEDRIELFARRYRDGWDCTGLDLDGNDIRDVLPSLEGIKSVAGGI